MKNNEMIDVIMAHSNGVKVQFRVKEKFNIGTLSTEWQETEQPGWDFFRCEFRIKPDLPCLYGYMLLNGKISLSVYHTQEDAERITGNPAVKLILAPDEEQPF